MAGLDPLFSVRNNFYLGAYQTAISDASKITGLTEEQKLERDVFVFRSYIELGSYEVRREGAGAVSARGWVGVAQGQTRRGSQVCLIRMIMAHEARCRAFSPLPVRRRWCCRRFLQEPPRPWPECACSPGS